MVGEAVTLRFIPAREDLDTFESLASRDHPQRKAIETVPPGAVLVVDCRAEPGAAAVGDILVARMKVRGAEGVVTDGGIRDVASAAEQGLPVYCAGPAAPPSIARHHAADANVPIACGGVAVYPGDVIVGDADGVVVIPARFAKEVAAAAAEQDRLETFLLREIQSGRPLFGTYPPDEDTIGRYRDTQES
jgi:regulator of RNase E activity RraA